jgi:hypothetical protein
MKNEKNLYIGVAVVSVLFCAYWFMHSKHSSSQGTTVTYGQVDSLRKETQIRKEMDRKKVAVDNYKSAPSLDNAYRAVEDETNSGSGIKLESDKHAVANEQAEPDVRREPVNALEAQINKRLVNDQQAAEFTAQQKRSFIENYKKQALAKGYLVELNDQLVVTKVQKVSKPKGPASIGSGSIPQEDVEIQEFDDDDGAE